MRKSLIVLLLFIFLGCSQSRVPTILSQDYNGLRSDGGVHKLKQSNDTLYELFCDTDAPCHERRSKIISTHETGEFTILKLKDLDIDTIPLSRILCPGKPYSVVALKSINNKQLEYYWPVFACLTQYQLDTIQINKSLLENKSFSTYFSDSYLKELSALKKVSSEDDMRTIIDAIENNDFDSGRIEYSAEQLNTACIEKGYNPVGAAHTLDSLWRAKVSANRKK